MEVTIASVGINWIWYIELIDHLDGTCTIEALYRRHNSRDYHPSHSAFGEWRENEARDVIEIRWQEAHSFHVRSVRNPKHAFSYGNPESENTGGT